MFTDLPPRPLFHVTEGSFFRYARPAGWRVTETASTIHLGAPEGPAGASLTLVTGGAGHMSPPTYLRWMLQVLGIAQVDFLATRDHPDLEGDAGETWCVTEAELTYMRSGAIIRAHVMCAISQGATRYTAATREYHTEQRRWREHSYWLPRVAGALAPNSRRDGDMAQDAVHFPVRAFQSVYESYAPLWQARCVPAERVASSLRNGTLGYERLRDPYTGQVMELPLEAYSSALHGYPSPASRSESLLPWVLCGTGESESALSTAIGKRNAGEAAG